MLYVQAASRPDRTHASFQAIMDGRLTLCLSPELLAEIRDVLSRENVRARFPGLTPQAVEIFTADVFARGTMIDPVPHAFTWGQHPQDDHLFNLAISTKAGYLVTWENRILKLGIDTTPAANLLRQLAPNLSIVSPANLAAKLKLQRETL
jgi:putative PIN family toxin of toxin-antitoxin system